MDACASFLKVIVNYASVNEFKKNRSCNMYYIGAILLVDPTSFMCWELDELWFVKLHTRSNSYFDVYLYCGGTHGMG